MIDDNEVTAKARRALHRIAKKRGKRDAENAVREFNVLVTNPSEDNINIYFAKRATGSASPKTLGSKWLQPVREAIFKLSRVISKSVAWKCDMLDDMVESLIRSNYEKFDVMSSQLEAVARKDMLSAEQVENFSTSQNPGILLDDDATIRKTPRNLEGFR